MAIFRIFCTATLTLPAVENIHDTPSEVCKTTEQVNSNAIQVNPDHPEFIGGEVITQDQTVDMFGHDFGFPNTYAAHEIPSDDEIAEMIEEQAQQWALEVKETH